MDNRIKVGIRARPLSTKELKTCAASILTCEENVVSLSSLDGKKSTHRYDWCFNETVPQDHVYQSMCKPLIDNIFEGFNATFFAYGQTGSGKTHTMGTTSLEDGIVPSALNDIFQKREELREKSVKVEIDLSFIEIYLEDCYDLLSKSGERTKVELRETKEGEVYAEGVTKHEIGDIESAAKCLSDAAKMRATASTAMNSTSSRSHAICTLTLKVHSKGKSTVSKLNLVDLAGSERAKKTDATGDTFKEGVSINQGLSTLGNVVSALVNKAKMTATAKKHGSGIPDDVIDKENMQNGQQSRGRVGGLGGGLGARKGLGNSNSNSSINTNNSNSSSGNSGKMEKPSTAAVPHFHVPYRESKLTYLLKDSLGGNGMTVLLTCVSPAESNLDETSNSLKFASRASSIVNKAKVNVDKESMSLQKEIQVLNSQLTEWQEKHSEVNDVLTELLQDHEETLETLDKSQQSMEEMRLLLAEKEAEKEELHAVLNEKEDAISELHVMLQHKEYAIIALKEQLHERDARINRARELEGTNGALEQFIAFENEKHTKLLTEKNDKIRQLQQQIADLTAVSAGKFVTAAGMSATTTNNNNNSNNNANKENVHPFIAHAATAATASTAAHNTKNTVSAQDSRLSTGSTHSAVSAQDSSTFSPRLEMSEFWAPDNQITTVPNFGGNFGGNNSSSMCVETRLFATTPVHTKSTTNGNNTNSNNSVNEKKGMNGRRSSGNNWEMSEFWAPDDDCIVSDGTTAVTTVSDVVSAATVVDDTTMTVACEPHVLENKFAIGSAPETTDVATATNTRRKVVRNNKVISNTRSARAANTAVRMNNSPTNTTGSVIENTGFAADEEEEQVFIGKRKRRLSKNNKNTTPHQPQHVDATNSHTTDPAQENQNHQQEESVDRFIPKKVKTENSSTTAATVGTDNPVFDSSDIFPNKVTCAEDMRVSQQDQDNIVAVMSFDDVDNGCGSESDCDDECDTEPEEI